MLIAGAGPAGLEAAAALAAMAGDRVAITVLAPEAEVTLDACPLAGAFAGSPPARYRVGELLGDIGAEHVVDAFRWLDAPEQVIHTRSGRQLSYDSLLLALGARRRRAFAHALTLDRRRLGEQLASLRTEVQQGAVGSVALIAGAAWGWMLPLYELALLLAHHAQEHSRSLTVTIVTPEEAPLASFGEAASAAVAEVLAREGIATITSASCQVREPGAVVLRHNLNRVTSDRIIALPQIYGPATAGVPKRARGGFLSVDAAGRVRDATAVYAAGDAIDYPVKSAELAGHQADVAAAAIATQAGAPTDGPGEAPVIHGALPAADAPLTLTAHLLGRHGSRSEVDRTPPAWSLGRHLSPYLTARAGATAR